MLRSCGLSWAACAALAAAQMAMLIASGNAALAAQVAADELVERASAQGELGAHAEAIRLATLAIEMDPATASAYYVRGRERFRAGNAKESIADFDKYIALRPEAAHRQWERGIACYYAGMYAAGAQQFESYQKYDGQDVENSVWRYLCMVPTEGVIRAEAKLLPIENDRRVPMMQVYELYRGKLQPEDVLAAARAGNPEESVLAARLFYAHLYLGLWHEGRGDKQQAARFIQLSADPRLREIRGINRYMWDVARIHHEKMRGAKQGTNDAK